MPILSNVAISNALKDGYLKLTPFNGSLGGSDFDECSVHLHLGDKVCIPNDKMLIEFNLKTADDKPGAVSETLSTNFDEVKIPANGWSLDPGAFALATTRERITLPFAPSGQQLAGRIEGRSRFARIGLLVHFTAPTIHPGFGVDEPEGNGSPITLELKNLGPHPIRLSPKLAICQLILERVDGPILRGTGAFDGQTDAFGRNEEAA